MTAVTYHRLVWFHGIVEPGGVFVFPLMYFFGDVIAEVYGYTFAKKVIYVAFFCDAFFSVTTYFITRMPVPIAFHEAASYTTVFEPLPVLFFISSVSMSISAFVNIWLLSKWRRMVNGRFFVIRSIGASAMGEGVLSLMSIPFIFWNLSWDNTLKIILAIYLFKIAYTIILSSVGGLFVKSLKIIEGVHMEDEGKNPLVSL